MKNNIPMKNTFSKATAHLRLKVSTITAQLRSIYGISILIFAFLTLGVGQAWADGTGQTLNYPYFYYYNDNSWSDVQAIVGRGWNNWNYSKVYPMGKSDNVEKLYFAELGDNWPNEYNQIAVLTGASSWGGEGNNIEARWGWATAHSDNVIWNYDMSYHKTYYWAGKGASSIATSVQTYTTTLNIKVKESGADSYSNGSTSDKPASTIKITGTYADGAGTWGTKRSDASWSSGSSCSYNTVISGKVTPSYSSKNDDWQFDGWYVGSTRQSTKASYDFYQYAATTIEARFTRIKYAVNFDQQSGSDGTTSIKATYGSAMPSITLPTRAGYDFQGYFTETGGAGTKYYNADGTSAKNSDLNTKAGTTLYAYWTPHVYSITLDKNEGDNHGSATITYLTTGFDTHSAPTKAGWSVEGYYTNDATPVKIADSNGNLLANKTGYTNSSSQWTKTSDATLYAHWKQTYSVTYYPNFPEGATTSGAAPTDATDYNFGASATVLGVNTMTATGYTFSGWNTAADGRGTDYAADASITMNANYTLFAQWTENRTSVTLAASPSGKGSFTIGGSPATSTTAGVETKPTVTAVPITGYFLTGTIWSKSNNNISLSADNTASTTITGCGTASTSSTLTATFTEKYLLCGSVNADGNPAGGMRGWATSGDNNAYSSVTYDGNTITIVANLTNAGTQYKCQIRDVQNSAWKGQTGTGSMSSGDQWTWDGTNDVYFTTTVAGSYTFTIDISGSSPSVRITYPGEPEHSATLSVNGHGSVSPSAGNITLRPVTTTTITATPEPGFRFKQWNVGGVSCSSTTSATATFTASAAGGTIEAEFTNDEVIYFDAGNIENEWGDEVYVTFLQYNFHWNDGDGKDGALIVENWVDNALHSVRMTRIPNTRIFYLDYSGLSGHDQVTQYVLFTSKSIPSEIYRLYEMAAVTRGDYSKTTNNMCVAENFREKDKNKTGYYCGYWMNYNDTKAGINLKIYDGSGDITSGNGDFTLSAAGSRTYTATVTLSANTTYRMELQGYNNTYYKNSGTMISTNCSGWSYVDRQATVGHITTTAGGEYTFTLNCADKLYLTADYPLAVGDYRIVYQGKVKDGGSVTSHPSQVIRQLAGGATERKDTVGFYVTGDWSLKLQKCSSIDPEITWVDACGSPTISKNTLGLDGKTGVYTFPLTLTSTGGSCDQITVGTPIPYTGNYYIRTDVADGGWEAYKRASDNRMIFSEYARDHSGYDYYHCHWTPTNTNVKFTIANDYSACITETFENDSPYVTEYGKLPYQASVRFMYNSATNSIGRAYLNGSSEEGVNTFLWLQGATAGGSEPKIFKGNGSALTNDTIKMQDKNNWIYQLDIKANEKARVKLISNYHFNGYDHLQYFKGTDAVWSDASTAEILGGNYSLHPEVKHDLRIIYDFKTNRLLSAWLVPETGTVASAAINTDVMILKQNQNDARQITFAGSSDELTEVDTVYTAIQLDKDFLTGNVASVYEKQFYWVSFPYRVKLNDVFGSIGNYGADWIMQRYNGKKRAANGFWIDSEPNWEFMDRSETLNPYEGYILTLDLGEFTSGSLKWNNNVTYLTLYFPSDGKVGNIKQTSVSVKYTDQSDYVCTITRDNRNIKDSYWRCIGSPSFATSTKTGWNTHDGSDEQWTTANLPFLYEWNKTTNVLSPITTDGYTFKPLTGYMVQYSGESIEWTNVVTPSVSAPKRQNSAATDLTYKLQLVRGEEEVDHTFVRFSDDENITAAFEFNQDLCKEYKSGGNIYTITSDAIQVAGNSLPLSTTQTTVVPVGVSIKSAGDYTFAIPEGTEGIGVTLVDNETGVRTSLSALSYTVNLTAGDYTGRFVLEISPIAQTPTGVETVTGEGLPVTGVRKVMIDGILYIVKDGKMYDARGARVQ